MRIRDWALILVEELAGELHWIAASRHLRTDPACIEFSEPRHGSRLDRRSRGHGCSKCMALRAFGRLPDEEPQDHSTGASS